MTGQLKRHEKPSSTAHYGEFAVLRPRGHTLVTLCQEWLTEYDAAIRFAGRLLECDLIGMPTMSTRCFRRPLLTAAAAVVLPMLLAGQPPHETTPTVRQVKVRVSGLSPRQSDRRRNAWSRRRLLSASIWCRAAASSWPCPAPER